MQVLAASLFLFLVLANNSTAVEQNPTSTRRLVSSALVSSPQFLGLEWMHSIYTNTRCLMIGVIGWGSMCITFQIKGHKILLTATSDPQGCHWHFSFRSLRKGRQQQSTQHKKKCLWSWQLSVHNLSKQCSRSYEPYKAAHILKVNLHSAFWAPKPRDPASLPHVRSCGDGNTDTGSSCFQLQSTTES